MFSTERLTLRAFRETDMEDLIRLCNDLEVQKLACEDYVVPRSPNFQETIKGWVLRFHCLVVMVWTNQGHLHTGKPLAFLRHHRRQIDW